MANAVFNSFESYLSKDSYNQCEHNSFDLSHIVNFTTTYGALVPFYLEDCLPTDKFRIKTIIKCQALPMANPIFNNIRLSTWFFFVPYQVLWHKFHRYIDGGKDGTYTAEEPYIKAKFSRNSLGDYLGFPILSETGDDPIKVSAFPFAAYQSIYKNFFMNEDLQTTGDGFGSNRSLDSLWFPADDNKFSLHDGLNWIMDEDDTTLEANQTFDKGTGNQQLYDVDSSNGDITTKMLKSPILSVLRFHNFNKDYFTSAMFSPQRGPAQGVNTVNPTNPFKGTDFDNMIDLKSINGYPNLTSNLANSPENDYFNFAFNHNDVSTDPDHPNKPLTVYKTSSQSEADAKATLAKYKNQLADFFNKVLAKQTSAAFTISDLMVASQIQLWLERNMQVKSEYSDFMKVHFGYAPNDENYHKPKYIGGTTQLINVSQVVQNSESNITPQGTVTGLAQSYDNGYVGDFFCNDFGLIMGIMCIMPEIYYTNGLDKKWVKKSRFDYVFPELTQLPPEPIYNFEIYANDPTGATSQRVFGYSGRCDNYRHRRNQSLADLRNPNMADFYSWNITREFGSTPTLQDNVFISTNKLMGTISLPADDTTLNVRMDHFPTANTVNPFIVQCGLNIQANRPLPFRNEPQTLNLRRG